MLLVIDSDTLDLERQREYEETALAAVEAAYARDYIMTQPLFKVFTFRPCIEVIFFEAPKALERLLGREVDERALEEGRARPKHVLQKLCGIHEPSWLTTLIRRIDEPMLDLLADGEQAAQLREAALSLIAAVSK